MRSLQRGGLEGKGRGPDGVIACLVLITFQRLLWRPQKLHLATSLQCNCPAEFRAFTYKRPVHLCDSWKQQPLFPISLDSSSSAGADVLMSGHMTPGWFWLAVVRDLGCCCLWPPILISTSPPWDEIIQKTETCWRFYFYFIPRD